MIIQSIRFDDDRIYGTTTDGRELWQSLLYYPRLLHATAAEREDYAINAFGIRWEKLDEDVSFESFAYDNPEPDAISRFFLTHPEIQAAGVAQLAGIEKSEMAQYVNGTARPTDQTRALIVHTLQRIGHSLSHLTL